MTEAKFIVFEGIDGAGTTTLSKMLVRKLQDAGVPALWTYEPTEGPIGQMIRRELGADKETFHGPEMALLFMADRAHHLRTKIIPMLKSGVTVVSDRYALSTLAYQSVDGCDEDWLYEVNKTFRVPDITFLLDVDAELGLSRVGGRGEKLERYEKLETLVALRARYLELFEHSNYPMRLIDSNQNLEATEAAILGELRLVEFPSLAL